MPPSPALDSIEALRVFVQVVDSGGFTAAGRIVGLTPTLVSRRIARLEAALGVRLLQRTTRSVHVTDEGCEFYRRCRRILTEVEGAAEAVRPVAGNATGIVRAVLPTVMLSLGIMEASGTLLSEHPGLGLQLSFTDQAVGLVAGGWDVAMHVGRPPDSTHIVRALSTINPQLAATPGYLARAGIPRCPDDLAEHECLRFISDRPQDTWGLVSDSGEERTVPVHGRLESDSSAALSDALYAGLGIGLATSAEVSDSIEDGRLARVLAGWQMQGIPLYLLMPAGRSHLPRIRIFADWLAAHIVARTVKSRA